MMIGRRIKVMQKFSSVKDIPDVFISQHVKLRGKIQSVSSNCVVHIEHLPIIRSPFKSADDTANTSLHVKLAGLRVVEPEAAVKQLMSLQSSIVWIKMWQRYHPNDALKQPCILCSVYKKKWPFNECINFTLLQMGVAEHYPMNAITTPLYRFNKRLNEAEKYAKRRRLGVWYHPSRYELIRATVREKVNNFTKFIRNPMRKTK